MNKSYIKAIGLGLLSILSVKSFAGGGSQFSQDTVCVGATTVLTFTTTNLSGNITDYKWEYTGDGLYDDATGSTISYPYSSSNTTVSLRVVTDAPDSNTVTLTIYYHPLPVADFTADSVCKGNPMFFSATQAANIETYMWDFSIPSDGVFTEASGPTPTATGIFNNAGTYLAGLQVTSDKGCVNQIYKNVTVNPLPGIVIPEGGFPDTVCIGSTAQFSVQGNVQTGNVTDYNWDFDNDGQFDDRAGSEVSFQFLGAGYYPVSVQATTNNGCTSQITGYVTVVPLPVIIFNFTGECEGAPVQFLNQSSNQVGSIDYLWSFGDTQFSSIVNPSHVYASEGTYTINLTGTSSYGCVNSATQSITINPGPSASFTYNEVCTGFITDFVNTSTSGGSVIEGYLWTYGDNDASVAQSPSHQYGWAGTYPVTLVVSSTEGCRDTATANVNVWALPTPHIAAAGPLAFCDGGSVDLSVDLEDGQSAIWSNAQTTATITVTVTGQYIVNVFDEHGCQQKDTIDVLVWALPNVTASNDTLVSLGYNVPLWAAGATFYNWSPETYLDNANVYDPTSVSPLETITYTVTGTDDNGCVNTADVIVTVNADYTFETVNLFTPNGDGFNDFWKIKNVNLYSDCVVKVFNRWGIEVYSSTAYQNDWDGTYKGEKLPEATYYYVVTCSGTEKEYDGAISILRNKN